MKTDWLFRLLFLSLFTFAIASCSNDDDPAPEPGTGQNGNDDDDDDDKPDASYSEVSLTYSGSPFYGKEASFELNNDGTTAKIRLNGVLPVEAQTVLENVSVTEGTDGYTFETDGVSAKGTSFKLSGSVKDKVLTINLTDIAIPDNPLSGNTYKIPLPTSTTSSTTSKEGDVTVTTFEGSQASVFNWRFLNPTTGRIENLLEVDNTDLSTTALAIVNSLLYLVLDEVTFLPDGNIAARYAPLPDDFNFMSLFMNLSESMRGTIQESPLNLCRYFVEGETVYIQPDLTMILWAVEMNKAAAAVSAKTKAGFDLGSIMELIPNLSGLLNNGIKFNLINNKTASPFQIPMMDGSDYYSIDKYVLEGDYRLCIDEDEITPVLTILPTLINMFIGDLSEVTIDLGGETPISIAPLLEPILQRVNYPTYSFEAGLILK